MISCEPQDLVTAARCFNCKWSAAEAIEIYLLCIIANEGVTPADVYVIGAEAGGIIGPEGGGLLGAE